MVNAPVIKNFLLIFSVCLCKAVAVGWYLKEICTGSIIANTQIDHCIHYCWIKWDSEHRNLFFPVCTSQHGVLERWEGAVPGRWCLPCRLPEHMPGSELFPPW